MPRSRSHPDVTALQQLLLWARDKGFRVGPVVEIGELKLYVQDMRQAKVGDPIGQATEMDVMQEHGVDEDPVEGTGG